MRDFFKQCLKDLEPLTGIRQLYFLESDLEEGAAKLDVLLAGMVATSSMFPYISTDAQKKIIREMMVKDQDYDSLNSRVIYKWLNLNKDLYFIAASKPSELPQVELTEEESKRIDELAASALAALSNDYKPSYTNLGQEIKKIQAEDQERQEGRKSFHYKPDPNKVILNEKKLAAARARGLDKLDLRDLTKFEVDGQVILARSQEEAHEIYLEVYE